MFDPFAMTTERISPAGKALMAEYPDPPERPANFDARRFPSSIADKPWPTRETHPHYNDAALRDLQAAWDYRVAEGKHIQACSAINKKHREDEVAAVKAKQDAAAQERADAKRAELLATLERRFIAAGGTAAEVKQDQDELLKQHLRQEALNANSAEEQARRGQWAHVIDGF